MNKFSIRMLRKKKKKCLDESNETIERTNFALEYYAKKKKKLSRWTNFTLEYYVKKKKKNCLNESNETIEGTNFAFEYYAKKKKKKSTNRMKYSREQILY